jgi:hypothetical protein
MCPIHLENKFFNDHILIRVILSPLKWFANFFRVSRENPWARYNLKKMAGKKGRRGSRSSKNP